MGSLGTKALFVILQIRERQRPLSSKVKERYKQLLNHAPAGIYEVDFLRRTFVSVNDVMCEYTGYTKEELLSLSPFDILTEESKTIS